VQIELADGVRSLPRSDWDALVGDDSPFLEWDWLASLEEAGCLGPRKGWDARPLLLRDGDELVAACPLYIKAHSEGEFVFDWSWADAAERAGIRYYPKLLVGVPFSPVGGGRLLVAPKHDPAPLRRALGGALREICAAHDLSGVHVNFCSDADASALESVGFLRRTGIQYHWHNAGYRDFDDYLGAFRSKRRNQIKRERREMERAGVRIEARTGDALDSGLFEAMYDFYLATIRSRYWGRQYLNRRFFDLLRERFRHRLVFVVAFQDGQPIAGTFNVAKGEALYGRYWGAARPLRHLHFNVCYYAAVEYCIEHGLARFEPGAGGDYKQLRGFDAQPTWSVHHLADPRLHDAVGRFLEQEREVAAENIDWLQENSALKAPGSQR